MQSVHAVPQDLAGLGEVCTRMGSPFFGSLLLQASVAYERDAVLRELLERHAHRSRIGLRLGGAAHFRALRGDAPAIAAHYPSTGGDADAAAAWNAVLQDIHANAAIYDKLIERPVQTNEVARAMPVLGAMLALAHAIPLPLRVIEIGSSAGLLLNFDRYRYSGEDWSWGDKASPAHLQNHTVSGKPLHPDAPLQIVERRGCDLNPLNVLDQTDADTLLCFIWPDQRERFNRLRAAIEIARAHPLDITRADGIAWLRTAAMPQDGSVTVLLHTVMTEHLTSAERESLREAIDEIASRAAAPRPFAWVRMEPVERGYHTTLTHWPANTETVIAASDGHAQNLRWYP